MALIICLVVVTETYTNHCRNRIRSFFTAELDFNQNITYLVAEFHLLCPLPTALAVVRMHQSRVEALRLVLGHNI